MAKQAKSYRIYGVTITLLLLIPVFSTIRLSANQQTQQVTQKEFSGEIAKAYAENNEELALSLIKENRLFVKPAVNDLIKESLTYELKGNAAEAAKMFDDAVKTAAAFERIFGEKNLSLAVSYLKSWSEKEKKIKLKADSLYAAGTSIRGKEPEEASVLYKEALNMYGKIGDERGEAEILGGLGLINLNLKNDYQSALFYYREALVKREKVDDRQLMGNTYISLGSIYYKFIKDYQVALSWFDKAEKIRSEIGDSINLGRTVHLKAATYEYLGELDKALYYYSRSFELNKMANNKELMAEALLKKGTILNNLGKYPEALEILSISLEMNRGMNNPYGISDGLNQIGFVYLNLGDLNKALELFNEAADIVRKENDIWGLAGIYNNMGVMLQKAGRIEKSLDYYNKALKTYEETEDQMSVILLLNNIGTICFDQKDYAGAEDNHLKGLKLSRDLKARDQEASFLLNLGNDHLFLRKLDQSIVDYDAGLKIALSLNSPDLIWRLYAGKAETYEQQGNYEKSVELNDSSLKIIEGLRNTLQNDEQKASYMASERYAFEDVINMLALLHEKDRSKGFDVLAFKYAESCKSRAFLDMLEESLAWVNQGADSQLLRDKEKIPSGYTGLKYPETVSLDEAMKLCSERNTVILEYSVGDSSTCLWVITERNYSLIRLPGLKKLREQIESIRFAMADPAAANIKFISGAGYSLYRELVQPAEPYLTKKSKLIIIPDGVLNYLPFEALLTENKEYDKKDQYSDYPFLVKKYPISYCQSASVLKSIMTERTASGKQRSANKRLVAFGDPVYRDSVDTSAFSTKNFSRLVYSSKEIESIASLFKTGAAHIYLKDAATEDNVKRKGALQDYSYVHFATHGFIDEKNPDLSSLVLTQNNNSGEDGFLRASEIFNLKMNASLVVLSACQTGLGKLVRGEGIVGLTRAFIYAGTPAVMVSLWSVSDNSTATLMVEFYKNLIKRNLTKTDALRKAQLSLLSDERFAHPFYWAPFVLFGDWR